MRLEALRRHRSGVVISSLVPIVVAHLLRINTRPGDSPFNTTCKFLLNKASALDGFLPQFRASSILPENETDELLARYQQVAAVYWRLDSDLAPGHNDLFKPDNMLFDGNRLWLVDWRPLSRTIGMPASRS